MIPPRRLAPAAALLLACVAPGCAPPPARAIYPLAHPASRAEADAALQSGLAWLVSHQNGDGSWGSPLPERPGDIYTGTRASHHGFRVATTALACQALRNLGLRGQAPPGGPGDALARGEAWLLAAPPPQRATGDEFYSVWAHAFLLRYVSERLADAPEGEIRDRTRQVAERELASVLGIQSDRGGWGYYDFGSKARVPDGKESTSFLTSTTLLALYAARAAGLPVPEARIDAAILFLQSLRYPDGSYAYGDYARLYPRFDPNPLQGSMQRIQPCNVAMHRWGADPDTETLRAGLQTLLRLHHFPEIARGRPYPHEGWYATAGYYYFYAHAAAAEALEALPEPDRRSLAGPLAATLTRTQDPDGAWLDFPLFGYGRAYGTALALDALGRILPNLE